MDYALPPLFALALWWAGTGAVLLLERPAGAGRAAGFTLATAVACGALACIAHTANDRSMAGAYAGFTCAMVVWGWHELAFLSGRLTGPRRDAASPGAPRLQRLSEAVQVLLWHEIALLGTAVALWVWQSGSPNPVASWTFGLLYAMRVSAKLNLYLGVRNLAIEFLPQRLLYVGSYFRRRRFNGLMPWSLLVGVVVAVWLFQEAAQVQDGARTARMLLASTLVLALAEHLMMVLPLEPTALWRWALRRGEAVAR